MVGSHSDEGVHPWGQQKKHAGLPSWGGTVEGRGDVGGGSARELLEQEIITGPSEGREWGDPREDGTHVCVSRTEPAHEVEN